MTSVLLSGCFGSTTFNYAGHYVVAEGNDCKPDSTSANAGTTFIEILKTGDQSIYKANMPEGKKQGLPPHSLETSPIENAISFTFSKQGKIGFFNSQPAIDITMTLQVNPTIPDSLVLSEWTTTVQGVGKAKKINLLDNGKPPKGLYDKDNIKGICLVKLKSLTS